MKNNKDIFKDIYENKLWNNGNPNIPLSGPGSSFENTNECSKLIDNFIYSNNLISILDLGCGDLTWIPKTSFFNDNTKKYLGVDIVENLINNHKKLYPNQSFLCSDITEFYNYNKYSLIIIRDVIFHLKNNEIIKIFNNIKNKFDFICITSCNNLNNNDDFNKWRFSEKNIHIEPFNISHNFESKIYENKFDRFVYIYKHENFYNS